MHLNKATPCTSMCSMRSAVKALPIRCSQAQGKQGAVAATSRNALEAGYRHLDCAPVYGNEALVGEAIQPWLKEHGRDSLFLTSKVWNDAHRPQLLRWVCRSGEPCRSAALACGVKVRGHRGGSDQWLAQDCHYSQDANTRGLHASLQAFCMVRHH